MKSGEEEAVATHKTSCRQIITPREGQGGLCRGQGPLARPGKRTHASLKLQLFFCCCLLRFGGLVDNMLSVRTRRKVALSSPFCILVSVFGCCIGTRLEGMRLAARPVRRSPPRRFGQRGGPVHGFCELHGTEVGPCFFGGRGPLLLTFLLAMVLMAKSGSAHGCSLPCTCRQKVEYIASGKPAHAVPIRCFPLRDCPFRAGGLFIPTPATNGAALTCLLLRESWPASRKEKKNKDACPPKVSFLTLSLEPIEKKNKLREQGKEEEKKDEEEKAK